MPGRGGLLLNREAHFLVGTFLRLGGSCTATEKLISCSIFPEAFVHFGLINTRFSTREEAGGGLQLLHFLLLVKEAVKHQEETQL